MRRLILAMVLVCGAFLPAGAQQDDIKGVIRDQIAAFKVDDFDTAFTYASPSIQGLFGTPENFGRMVTQGYPMVWRPADVRYLDLRDEGGILRQDVQVTDGSGRVFILEYSMIETRNGWKINGVRILDVADVTT